jgi:hypothetical protein
MKKYFKEESRRDFYREADRLTFDEVRLGALMRIADSLERLEKPYLALLDKVKLYRGLYEDELERRRGLERSNRALRAWVTRLKKSRANNLAPGKESER